jgi:AraC family transcriptional regulator
MGSPSFRTKSTDQCSVTEAWLPPSCVLEPHTHDRTIIAVMLDGWFESAIAARRLMCDPCTVWTEPCQERHANHVANRGAHVLVIQPDPARDDMFRPFRSLTDEVCMLRHGGIAGTARRVLAEMAIADDLSGLAIDSLVLTMMTAATRVVRAGEHHGSPPRWLLDARDALHDGFRDSPQLAGIAKLAGVHAAHLTHAFRRYFHTTPGAYVRALRLQWALERLRSTRESISAIALRAGYADQSHFTRECRRTTGWTPGRIRSDSQCSPAAGEVQRNRA